MNSPFKIHKPLIVPGTASYVSWTPNVKKFVYSYIILDILFAVIKCDEVGFGVVLNSGEVEPLWIDKGDWLKDKSRDYSTYVQEMYNIVGILFRDHSKAVQFHDWLEKKYMWETLSG